MKNSLENVGAPTSPINIRIVARIMETRPSSVSTLNSSLVIITLKLKAHIITNPMYMEVYLTNFMLIRLKRRMYLLNLG